MLVKCTKCKNGIIIKLVGDNMMIFTKRQKDFHPIKVTIYGKDYSVTVGCTLCGEGQFIEVVDGKVNTSNLTLEEDKNGKEENNKPETGKGGDGEPGGAGDGANPTPDDPSKS